MPDFRDAACLGWGARGNSICTGNRNQPQYTHEHNDTAKNTYKHTTTETNGELINKRRTAHTLDNDTETSSAILWCKYLQLQAVPQLRRINGGHGVVLHDGIRVRHAQLQLLGLVDGVRNIVNCVVKPLLLVLAPGFIVMVGAIVRYCCLTLRGGGSR